LIGEDPDMSGEISRLTKTCLDCKYENKEDAIFCRGCGVELSKAGLRCSNCDVRVPIGSRFCDNCGNTLPTTTIPDVQTSTGELGPRLTTINEQLITEAKSRLTSNIEKNVRDLESRMNEIFRQHLDEAESKLDRTVSSLTEDFRNRGEEILKDKLSSILEKFDSLAEAHRRRLEAELGVPTATVRPESGPLSLNVCQFCGAALRTDSKFCLNCGKKVEKDPRVGTRPKRVQPKQESGP
jgi:hypothetical protein